VAPRGREVEVFQAPAQQEGPPRGGRRPRDEAAGGPAEAERPAQRPRGDDPGAGPSHAPPAAAGVDKDIVHRFRLSRRFCEMCQAPVEPYPGRGYPGSVCWVAAAMAIAFKASSCGDCYD
jgi:hypothetical protein